MRQRPWIIVLVLALALCLAAAAKATFTDTTHPPEVTPDISLATPAPSAAGEAVEITITALGDVTLGGNRLGETKSTMYTKVLESVGGDLSHFFANVQEYFANDDLTLVNFEGTLTNQTKHNNNEFCFRVPPEDVAVLTLGSVEAVALENNHVMDYLEQGYKDTAETLSNAGIAYASEDHPGLYTVKGITIGMLAYQTFDNQYPRLAEKMPQDIAMLRPYCDIIIVSYHWGNEKDYAPTTRQVELGRATIDAGADLVLGHHSHRINPIELYNGKYIVYSLGNGSFSGNSKPSDMDTFLFQQKFIVRDGVAESGPFRIIPASISSVTGKSGDVTGTNDLATTPFAPDSKGTKRVIKTLLDNGKKLKYAVPEYPTTWPEDSL